MPPSDVLSPIRVLVVDDVSGVVDTVVGYLQQESGIECVGFHNALIALQHFEAGQFDCVVSDLKMPEMPGDELWSELIQTDPDIALIFISGVVDLRTAVHFMSNGAVSVLEKPLDALELQRAVIRAAERTRRLRAERTAFEQASSRYQELSAEEVGVLDCMLAGLSNKATAYRLELSERTVDRRRQSIFQKLQVESIIQLATLVAQIKQARDRFV